MFWGWRLKKTKKGRQLFGGRKFSTPETKSWLRLCEKGRGWKESRNTHSINFCVHPCNYIHIVHDYKCVCIKQYYYSVSQKIAPSIFLRFFFTQVKCISVKFCQHVVSSYLHIFTNFDRFTLIFKKMALIFLVVPIVFNVFSFKFHQVKSP